MANKSPYKEGDVKWVFRLEGSYPNYDFEYIVQVEFQKFTSGWGHSAKVIRGNDFSNGHIHIDTTIRDDRVDWTKVYDSYSEAKEHLMKWLELKKKWAIDRIEKEQSINLERLEQWESYNKDLLRESTIDEILKDD